MGGEKWVVRRKKWASDGRREMGSEEKEVGRRPSLVEWLDLKSTELKVTKTGER